MCTALAMGGRYPTFGRTLDLERSFGEQVVLTPRRYAWRFADGETREGWYALLGVALVCDGVPLYFDAMNEVGLAMAGLNFPGYAVYRAPSAGRRGVPSFELIPWVLSRCGTLEQARDALAGLCVTDAAFSPSFPPTPLHWMLSDGVRSLAIEPREGGLQIFENPFGVLTNAPDFTYHATHAADFAALSPDAPCNRLSPCVPLVPYSRGMGAMGLPGDYSSASRFVRAIYAKTNTVAGDSEREAVSRHFHAASAVAVPDGCVRAENGERVRTVYTSCASLRTRRYYVSTYACRRLSVVPMKESRLDGSALCAYPMPTLEDVRELDS